jgi:hypothetical protein
MDNIGELENHGDGVLRIETFIPVDAECRSNYRIPK